MEEHINEEIDKENEEQTQNTYCVYMHINLHNRKKYIGQTKHGDDPNKRWQYRRGYKQQIYFYRALQIHSDWEEDWSHHILENGLSKKEADEREKYWIAYYDTTNPKKRYNLTKRGQGYYKLTEEKKKNLHKDNSREKNPMFGKKQSQKTKDRMSQIRKGKYCGSNHPRYGQHWSEEMKQKLQNSNQNKKSVVQLDKNNNVVNAYVSIHEAMRSTGINDSSIIRCCKRKVKTAGGFKWQYQYA